MKFYFMSFSRNVQFSFTKFPFCFDPSQIQSSDRRIFYSHQACRPVCQRQNQVEPIARPVLVALTKATEIYVALVAARGDPNKLQLVSALRVLIWLRPKRQTRPKLVSSILAGQLEMAIVPSDAVASWHLCPIPRGYSHSIPSRLQLSGRVLSWDCNLVINF